jgi:hypothetical protein
MKNACPSCQTTPSSQSTWSCFCGHSFNHFQNTALCPNCNYQHEFTDCQNKNCMKISLHTDWYYEIEININVLKLELDLNTIEVNA